MYPRTIITITALATGVVLTGWAVRRRYSRRFRQDVARLFARADSRSTSTFRDNLLTGLPEPVQRYFRHVLPEGYPYIRCVRLKHQGLFRTAPGKDWTPIRGEQYFTADPPGFIWKGRTALFTARDMYLADRGRLVVTLLSWVKVVDARGKSVDQGELLRWLGESVWFPTSLLPSDRLQWSPIDAHTARLDFTYRSWSVYYLVSFNAQGEITRLETERYMAANRRETWVGELSDYQPINGVLVPTVIRATWKLTEGDHTYVDFRVTTLEYDRPELF